MKILAVLEKSKNFWFLITTSIVFFLLRLPSLFEPYWYGDEGIYQVIGIALKQGRLLYKDIWDNKPPLLYLLYALFNSDQFMLRLVSLIVGLLSIIVFLFLAQNLFCNGKSKNQRVVYFATFLFALILGLPIIEGNIANAENFMMLPILLAALLVYKISSKDGDYKKYFFGNFQLSSFNSHLIIIGFLLSIAFLFKIVAIFDLIAFSLFIFFLKFRRNKFFLEAFFDVLLIGVSFILPIILTTFFFLFKGAFWEFYKATFTQNVGYISYGNQFFITQGLLLLKLIFLAIFTFYLFSKRNLISKSSLFILLWLAFSIFNALFSGRPYTHYLLMLLPSFCLFVALIMNDKKYRKIGIVFLFIGIILISANFLLYKKTSNYYQNFISLILGRKNVSTYQSFFDHQTVIDYELAQYIKNHTDLKDNVFIWGNNAQLYKLANKLPPGKFIVAYHMTASKETLKETEIALFKANPKYIIVTSPANFIPYSLSGYRQKISIDNSLIYERAF